MSQTMQQTTENHSRKPTIYVPKMRYHLEKQTAFETLIQLSKLTHGFYDVPVDFAQWIIADVRSRNFTSFGYLPAPLSNSDLIKQVIGIEGYYLKLTTEKTGVDFIWHDRECNEFHFWGEHSCCIKAMNEIRYRISKISAEMEVQAQQTQVQQTQVQAQQTHVQTEAPVPTLIPVTVPVPETILFMNDVNPHPAVCFEAVFRTDENGEHHAVASKHYHSSD